MVPTAPQTHRSNLLVPAASKSGRTFFRPVFRERRSAIPRLQSHSTAAARCRHRNGTGPGAESVPAARPWSAAGSGGGTVRCRHRHRRQRRRAAGTGAAGSGGGTVRCRQRHGNGCGPGPRGRNRAPALVLGGNGGRAAGAGRRGAVAEPERAGAGAGSGTDTGAAGRAGRRRPESATGARAVTTAPVSARPGPATARRGGARWRGVGGSGSPGVSSAQLFGNENATFEAAEVVTSGAECDHCSLSYGPLQHGKRRIAANVRD